MIAPDIGDALPVARGRSEHPVVDGTIDLIRPPLRQGVHEHRGLTAPEVPDQAIMIERGAAQLPAFGGIGVVEIPTPSGRYTR